MCTEPNDGMEFTTVKDNKEEPKKGGNKKEVTCFRCKKVGHLEEEFPPKTGKKGANMLILDQDSSVEYSSQEEGDTEQYIEEKDNTGQSEQEHSVNGTVTE